MDVDRWYQAKLRQREIKRYRYEIDSFSVAKNTYVGLHLELHIPSSASSRDDGFVGIRGEFEQRRDKLLVNASPIGLALSLDGPNE